MGEWKGSSAESSEGKRARRIRRTVGQAEEIIGGASLAVLVFLAGRLGDGLGGLGDLEHVVEAQLQQGGQGDVAVPQAGELAIQHWRDQGNGIRIGGKRVCQRVNLWLLCVGWAQSDALTADDTAVIQNNRMFVAHPNRFRWAALDTGRAACAQATVQRDRM